MEKVINLNPEKPKRKLIDAYICPELHATVTRIREGSEGKAVRVISCPECKQPAQSQNYNINQNFEPVIEWYKPDENEMKSASLSMEKSEFERFSEYVNKGGLLSKLIEKTK